MYIKLVASTITRKVFLFFKYPEGNKYINLFLLMVEEIKFVQ